MKLSLTLIVFAATAVSMVSCSEKKPTNDIIARKTVKKAPAGPGRMQDYSHNETISWLGKEYGIEIRRNVDKELPMIVDDSGNKFYDNKVKVIVTRPDGSVFFDRTFSKDDFSSCMTENYMKKSALLGIVIDKVEGDNLRFAASVGSPDVLSDEYMPLVLTLSRMGDVSIKKDTRLDTLDDADEGV